MSAQKLTSVAVGEKVKMTLTVAGKRDRRTVTVGAYHPTPPGNDAGHWYCVTHDEHFSNQLQKDIHITTGDHHLAWVCHEHGIEQPMKEPVK